MALQNVLDLAQNGDARAAAMMAPHPELPRLLAAGMPDTGNYQRVTLAGDLYGPGYGAYRFEICGPTIDPGAAHGCPTVKIARPDGVPLLIVQAWLVTVRVNDCQAWGEITWTPEAGEAVTICGIEKAHGAGELGRIYKALGLFRRETRSGRPIGSGHYSDPEIFGAKLTEAWAAVNRSRYQDMTPANVAAHMGLGERQFRRLLHDLCGLTWAAVKRGSF